MVFTGGVYANACRFQRPVSLSAPKSLLAELVDHGYYVPGNGRKRNHEFERIFSAT
jgi:hypothetical protein